MPRVATIVPAEDDILCEKCGYTLNGLPETGNCPECGKPITHSLGSHRSLSAFEARPSIGTFAQTSLAVLLRPAHFYQSLATRQVNPAVVWFGRCHRAVASVLFSLAASAHAVLHSELFLGLRSLPLDEPDQFVILLVPLAATIYVLMALVTRLAAGLTTWEARYRGIRLPLTIVMRGLSFHYAHYVPVALVAAATVCGYVLLLYYEYLDPLTSPQGYLYTLSGEVVVGAAYLFYNYWIAMRNMMFANR